MAAENNFNVSEGAWKSPELPAFLFLGLLVGLLSIRQNFMLRDLDVCWLIRTGELIWQTGHLPETDVFSFTHQGQPWVLYQWGFEVYAGGLHRLAGLGGVIWGCALLIALTYALLLHFLLRLGINRYWCMGLVALTMCINNFHWWCRPNTASVLAYVILITLLESYRCNPGRQIWVLPWLFLLWANVHLGFVLGLIVVLVYGLWGWFAPEAFRGQGSLKDSRLLLVLPLCLLATCLNPYGPSLFAYLWQLSQATTMNSNIIELQSPDFHSPFNLFFIVQIVLLLWWGDKHYCGRSLFLTLICFTLWMGLYSVRHLAYFSLPATIHLAYCLRVRQGQVSPAPSSPASLRRGWGWALIGSLALFSWTILINQWHPGFYDFEDQQVPKGAVDYLAREAQGPYPHRVLCSEAQWDDYLIYRLYPRLRVFIDTRFDMYGEKFFQEYVSLLRKLKCDLEVFSPWQIEFLILKKDKHLAEWPKPRNPWTLVYEDVQSLIYRHLTHKAKSAEQQP